MGTADTLDDTKKKTYRTPQRLAKETFSAFTGDDKALICPFWSDTETEMSTSEVKLITIKSHLKNHKSI